MTGHGDLQIAFQGGGAKLALLLPVVDAILELEKHGEIRVTRVSGTSAGAIAASLVAGKANMGALREFLSNMASNRVAFDKAIPKMSSMAFYQKWALLANLLLRNKPLASDTEISLLLEAALRAAGISGDARVGDLGRPCFILSANIAKHERIVASDEDPLVQALMDSSALPFIFRTTGDHVDGGLLDNLPIEALRTPASPQNEHGEIVAVSFAERNFVAPAKSSLTLASALLDSVITNKTRSSKNMLGSANVFELPSNVGGIRVESFDTDSFFRFMSDENAYTNIKNSALQWFRNFVITKKQAAATATQISLAAAQPDEASKALKAQYGNLRRLAQAYHQHEDLVQTESILEVIAHGLIDDESSAKRDTVRFIDRFRSLGGPVHMFATRLFAANAAEASGKDIKIFNANREAIPFVSFAVMDEEDEYRWTLCCFLKPVLGAADPGGTITVVQEQEVANVMLPLKRQGSDYLGTIVSQAMRAERVEMRLCVPESFGELSLENGTVEEVLKLELGDDPFVRDNFVVVSGEVVSEVVEACPPQFRSYVWRAVDCKRDETVRVIYRRRRNA